MSLNCGGDGIKSRLWNLIICVVGKRHAGGEIVIGLKSQSVELNHGQSEKQATTSLLLSSFSLKTLSLAGCFMDTLIYICVCHVL